MSIKCHIYSMFSCVQSDGTSDEMKREQMEKLVREELERWDSETSVPQSGRGASPADSNVRSRSRPGSSANAGGVSITNLPHFFPSFISILQIAKHFSYLCLLPCSYPCVYLDYIFF